MAETIVAGLPIPSTSPLFLMGVGVHVACGLVAVAAGLAAMLARKGPGRHPRSGTIYLWALAGLSATAALLAAARWTEDKTLFGLALLALGCALIGRTAQRRGAPGWARLHITAMGLSYVIMLTAFYVDNGKALPVWRNLPSLAYWLGPLFVGGPIILAVLARHPLARAVKETVRR
jgi:hypothetical protein